MVRGRLILLGRKHTLQYCRRNKIAILTCSNVMFFIGGANVTVFSVMGDFWWEAEKVDSSGVRGQNKRTLPQRHTRADQLTSDRAQGTSEVTRRRHTLIDQLTSDHA